MTGNRAKIAVVVGSSVFSLLVAEVFLRVFFPVREAVVAGNATSPKASLYGWHMLPGQTYMPYDPDTREFLEPETLNSEGWHDVEHSREKKPGTYRIVVLGDSVTWGVPRLSQVYTRRLEALLHERGRRDVEVVSLGMSGWGTDQVLEALEREGLGYQPDLVIYQYCDNDLDDIRSPSERMTPEPTSIHWKKVFKYELKEGKLVKIPLTPRQLATETPSLPPIVGWRAWFRKSALLTRMNDFRQAMISQFASWKRRTAERSDFTPPPNTRAPITQVEMAATWQLWEALVRRMADVSRKAGAEFLIYPITGAEAGYIAWAKRWNLKYEHFVEYHDTLLKTAQAAGIEVIESKRTYERYSYDPHPTARGNLDMAEDIAEFLLAWRKFPPVAARSPAQR